MKWLRKFFSADNAEVDIKAVLSAGAFVVALGMYVAYGIKGLLVTWDMPPAIRDISAVLIGGGVLGAGSTLLNQRLGITGNHEPPQEPTGPPEGPVG